MVVTAVFITIGRPLKSTLMGGLRNLPILDVCPVSASAYGLLENFGSNNGSMNNKEFMTVSEAQRDRRRNW